MHLAAIEILVEMKVKSITQLRWNCNFPVSVLQVKKPAAHLRGNASGVEHTGKKGRKRSSAEVSLSDKVQSKTNRKDKSLEQLGRKWISALRLLIEASGPQRHFKGAMLWFTNPSLRFLPDRWFLHVALRPCEHQHLDRHQRHQIHQGMPPKQRSDLTSNFSERT